MKANFNDYIIVYPTEKGWEAMRRIWMSNRVYLEENEAMKQFDAQIATDGGFGCFLWKFISEFHPLLYNGQKNFTTANFNIVHR